jgi:hypothetical protein
VKGFKEKIDATKVARLERQLQWSIDRLCPRNAGCNAVSNAQLLDI